jgi:hypothetical protein
LTLALTALAVATGLVLARYADPLDGPWSAALGDDGGCQPGERCYTGPLGTEGVGLCHGGFTVCKDDQWACADEVTPTAEVSGNTDDEDCDGEAAAATRFGLPADPGIGR